jgi:hypothetical protein
MSHRVTLCVNVTGYNAKWQPADDLQLFLCGMLGCRGRSSLSCESWARSHISYELLWQTAGLHTGKYFSCEPVRVRNVSSSKLYLIFVGLGKKIYRAGIYFSYTLVFFEKGSVVDGAIRSSHVPVWEKGGLHNREHCLHFLAGQWSFFCLHVSLFVYWLHSN